MYYLVYSKPFLPTVFPRVLQVGKSVLVNWQCRVFIVIYISLSFCCCYFKNRFAINGTSGCTDGEFLQMNVMPSSKIHVLCPNHVTILESVETTIEKEKLFENLWIIYDKESFETCNVNTTSSTKEKNRQLIQCDVPLKLKYYTVVFQPYSAVNGLEFTPGQYYYFLGKLFK